MGWDGTDETDGRIPRRFIPFPLSGCIVCLVLRVFFLSFWGHRPHVSVPVLLFLPSFFPLGNGYGYLTLYVFRVLVLRGVVENFSPPVVACRLPFADLVIVVVTHTHTHTHIHHIHTHAAFPAKV
ncbi:hypothetical protein B0T18DRAFT_418085, partial [Schizothecium vesticola]